MTEIYLEITFRHGRPLAAYLYLPRQPGDKSARTRQVHPGMVIDFSADGRSIGIEITAPGRLSLPDMNRVVKDLGLSPIAEADLAPLLTAA